jgi:GT2 family glycosyltransferase
MLSPKAGQQTGIRIAAILTCHNRRELTISSLAALRRQASPFIADIDVYLVDDGSTDGTSDSVRQQFPHVHILNGDGNLFWNRGMHMAFAAALDDGFDAYFWMNDDTVLRDGALHCMVETALHHFKECGRWPIVVGATVDPESGAPTYGGLRRVSRINPLNIQMADAALKPVTVDTFNGNLVLIPDPVARIVGNLDPAFEHSMGDTDYGFRARRAGVTVLVAPEVAGFCAINTSHRRMADTSLGPWDRVRLLSSRRFLPWRSWLRLVRRHGGVLWPLIVVWPYARILFRRPSVESLPR